MDSMQIKIILNSIRRCVSSLIYDDNTVLQDKVSDTEFFQDDSVSYIIYAAEKIVSQNICVGTSSGEKKSLRSVFNLLNDNEGNSYYHAFALSDTEEINYPDEKNCLLDDNYLNRVKSELKEALNVIDITCPTEKDIKSILCVLENILTYYPAAGEDKETDISLYDKIKRT